jgi:putative glutamine amidotransferase
MSRKKIGIPGFYRNDMFGVHTDYLNFVEQFGTPVIIPQVSRKDFFHQFKGLEGLILPGGADVNPWRYVSNRLHGVVRQQWFCGSPDPALEHFDTQILPGLIHAGFPVFGICRGLQTLNVHFGGTLRNVDWHKSSKSKADLVHEVIFVGSNNKRKVNSFHHQAIGRLAEGFNILAQTDDGIAEIISHTTLPVVGVQYHPERFKDEWSNAICSKLFA